MESLEHKKTFPKGKASCIVMIYFLGLRKISIFKVYKTSDCDDCDACLRVCEMGTRPNEMNCTNCGDCLHVCHKDAIRFGRKG